MAVLRDTIVHGILNSTEGFEITENRKNLATLHNGILIFGDPIYGMKQQGIDWETDFSGRETHIAEGNLQLKTRNGNIFIDADNGSITINAKRNITITSENNGYSFNVFGDISENSYNGGKSVIVSGDIITKTNDGKYELSTKGNIVIKSSDGAFNLTSKGNNYQKSDAENIRIAGTFIQDRVEDGPYSLNVSKAIMLNSTEGEYSLEVEEDITMKSISGGYNLDVKEDIIQHSDNGTIKNTTLNGDYLVGTERGTAKVTAGKYLELDAPRIKVKQSQGIYGTTDPNDLLLEGLEEGMIYFKIVD